MTNKQQTDPKQPVREKERPRLKLEELEARIAPNLGWGHDPSDAPVSESFGAAPLPVA